MSLNSDLGKGLAVGSGQILQVQSQEWPRGGARMHRLCLVCGSGLGAGSEREKGRSRHAFEPQSDPVVVSHSQEANPGLCDLTFCALAATEYNTTHTAPPRLQSTSASTSHRLCRTIFTPQKHESDCQGSDPSYAV